jgi:hypothetical protein
MTHAVVEPSAVLQTLTVALAIDDGRRKHDLSIPTVVVPR